MATKLETLAKVEGKTVDQLFADATFDSIASGICTNKDCDYTSEVEPDCQGGYCENCGTQTVSSCLVIAGLI